MHDSQSHDGKSMNRLAGDGKFGAILIETALRKYRELRAALRGRMLRPVAFATVAAGIVTSFACLRTAPYFFVVSLRTTDAGVAELYYDAGRGINAVDSVATHLHEGNSTLRFPLQPAVYHSIRFDPVDHGYCDITIRELKIVNVSGDLIRSFSPNDLTGFHDISNLRKTQDRMTFSLRVDDKDPNFTMLLRPSLELEAPPRIYLPFALKTFFLSFVGIALSAAAWLFFARRHWQWAFLGAGILGLIVFLGARSRFYAPVNFDEASFIWYGAVLNAGGIPYRDIFEPKGPVIFFANALGLSLFGLSNFQFRIVPTAVAIASIFLLYLALLKRQILHWVSLLVAIQVALWLLAHDFHDTGLNDTETYGFALTIIGLSFGFLARSAGLQSTRTVLHIGSGIVLGVAVLTKELFVFSVVPVWLFLGFREDNRRLDRHSLFLSASGVILTAAGFIAYLLSHSALDGYFYELDFARRLAGDYYATIDRFPKITGISVVSNSWRMLHQELYNLDHLAFVLTLCAVAWVTHRIARAAINPRRVSVAIIAVFFGIVAISVGYCFWKHYFLMGATGPVLLAIVAADWVSSYLKVASRRINIIAGLVLFIALVFVGWRPTTSMLTESYSPRVASWDPIVTEIIEQHSAAGDYVLAPGVPTILVALHRKNPYVLAGPSDNILPYVSALPRRCQIDSLRQQLEQNLPKVCYFPAWFRPEQKLCQQWIYQPVLSKHNYKKVDETLWYLVE